MHSLLISILFFVFGSIIGSFLNVVILRYRTGRSLGGRSGCFTCGKKLSWYELIPIGSFLSQRGRCAGCRTKLSVQYPLVEALTGFLFVFLFWKFESVLYVSQATFAILFVYYGAVMAFLVILSVYDIRHKILPDQWVFLLAGLGLIGSFFIHGTTVAFALPDWEYLLAAIVLPAPFSLLWLVSKGKWMGFGDAKFMIAVGFLLGLSAGFAALLLSFWIGALVGVVLLFASRALPHHKRYSIRSAIPFGPFIALATAIVFFAGISAPDVVFWVGHLFVVS